MTEKIRIFLSFSLSLSRHLYSLVLGLKGAWSIRTVKVSAITRELWWMGIWGEWKFWAAKSPTTGSKLEAHLGSFILANCPPNIFNREWFIASPRSNCGHNKPNNICHHQPHHLRNLPKNQPPTSQSHQKLKVRFTKLIFKVFNARKLKEGSRYWLMLHGFYLKPQPSQHLLIWIQRDSPRGQWILIPLFFFKLKHFFSFSQ